MKIMGTDNESNSWLAGYDHVKATGAPLTPGRLQRGKAK